MMNKFIAVILYLIFAPFLGGLLAGLDRKFTARLQGRVGPPIIQQFLDVAKLLQKENLVVHYFQNLNILFYLIFMIFTGVLFFAGENILLVIFSLTLTNTFFILGAHKTSSPYSFLGAQRELIQMISYEPAMLFAAIGMYMVAKSFYISDIAGFSKPLVVYLPGLFLAFIYVLAIKFRKSPFDLSTSYHAHQELVKGITTEFTAKTLAAIEVAGWYEIVLVLGFVYLFFAPLKAAAFLLAILVYFVFVFLDNVFARVRWQFMLLSSWFITLLAGVGNIIIWHILRNLLG
jgi:formate hydrogenlyase subunit 4